MTLRLTVAFINERVAAHVYRGSLEIGEYVLVRFFNNDIRLAGSMNGHKSVSYSKLCNHPELCVSRSTLTNMVKTFAQEGFLTAGWIPTHEMKYSQKMALTRMENNVTILTETPEVPAIETPPSSGEA